MSSWNVGASPKYLNMSRESSCSARTSPLTGRIRPKSFQDLKFIWVQATSGGTGKGAHHLRPAAVVNMPPIRDLKILAPVRIPTHILISNGLLSNVVVDLIFNMKKKVPNDRNPS
jgi:hypothetical protein